MSKILNSLSATMEARSQKYTALVQQQKAEEHATAINGEAEHRITLDKQTFFFVLCCGMLIGLFSLTVSYKALVNIQAKNVTVAELRELVTKQDQQITALNTAVQQLGTDQSQQLSDIKKSVNVIDHLVTSTDRQMSKLAVDSNVVHVIVNSLKDDSKSMKQQYSDLSEEVRTIKNLQAQRLQAQDLQLGTVQ